MRIIKNQMEQLADALQESIDRRIEIFDTRSEKWQESLKGEIHLDETSRLEEILYELKDWISEIEDF